MLNSVGKYQINKKGNCLKSCIVVRWKKFHTTHLMENEAWALISKLGWRKLMLLIEFAFSGGKLMLLTLMLMIEFALLGGKLMLLTLVSWKKISYNSTSGELFLSFDNICVFHHLYTNCDMWTKQSTIGHWISESFS